MCQWRAWSGCFDAGAAARRDAAAEIVMVVEAEGRRVGLIVDELLAPAAGRDQDLDTTMASVDGIAGATVLGDGSVALILDVERLTRDLAGPLAA